MASGSSRRRIRLEYSSSKTVPHRTSTRSPPARSAQGLECNLRLPRHHAPAATRTPGASLDTNPAWNLEVGRGVIEAMWPGDRAFSRRCLCRALRNLCRHSNPGARSTDRRARADRHEVCVRSVRDVSRRKFKRIGDARGFPHPAGKEHRFCRPFRRRVWRVPR